MHARRIRTAPASGPIDRRRLAAAGLSAVLPGLGQAFNRRRRLSLLFLVPSLLVITAAGLAWATQTPTRLAAWAVAPPVLAALLTLNVLVLGWRLVAAGQAFLDTRRHGPTGRLGIVGIALLAMLIVVPHLLAYSYGTAFAATFARIFDGQQLAAAGADPQAGPGPSERLNILIVGVDAVPGRTATLTDTMMVASFDPVGKTASIVSLPRDLIDVPLGDGDRFGPKLNSLMSYAETHRARFPKGGIRTLEAAVGALLGIPIHYFARMEFAGFVSMVDAVGGVDITVAKAIDDPGYDGFGEGRRGWSISAGRHHLDGANALAYARSRKSAGESDFTRAGRQQQLIVALKDAATRGGSLFWKLPALLDAIGDTIRTDLPIDRLPLLAAAIDEMRANGIARAVIGHPLVRSVDTRYGSSLEPDLAAIRTVAARLFPPPGEAPTPWPTPKASASSSAPPGP
ncbi:MAG TPA: LCP family protein [Candidatus Limnocylindrales bacterium]|nr:LCP family protein [Candidatus Limnocylindrales bacterium]